MNNIEVKSHLNRKTHPKIVEAIQKYITNSIVDLHYYGELCLYINFHETKSIPTAGVNFTKFMNFYYNPDFINDMNEKQLNFLMFHELFHLLWDHQKRSINLVHKMSNYAQDMIINTIINHDMGSLVQEPNIKPLYIPSEYKGDHIFEDLYHWLMEQKEKYDEWKNKQNNEGSKDKDDCPVSDNLKSIFENYDATDENGGTLDVHIPDDASPEMKKAIRNAIKNALKARGLETNNINQTLGKLQKKKKDYIKEIKRSLSQMKGSIKKSSYKRPNRRGIKALKGKIQTSTCINAVLDTSGSMCNEFDKALSYIFQSDIEINLVQCDTEVHSDNRIKNKNELQRVRIQGLGGTIIQPGLNYIKEHHNKHHTVVLTDGYTDDLDFTGMKFSLLITTGAVPKTVGNVKVIQVSQNDVS